MLHNDENPSRDSSKKKQAQAMTQQEILRNNTLKFGIIIAIIGGTIATIKAISVFGTPVSYLLPLGMTVIALFIFYLYMKKVDNTLLAFLILSTVFVEILLKEKLTDVGAGIYFWIFMLPVTVFAFFTPIKSLMMNLIFLGIFLLFHRHGLPEFNPQYFLFPIAFSYITITIFNFIYQRFHEKMRQEISQKTAAIHRLNYSLKEDIQKAVAESKAKDKMMEQQAKLAQMGELLSMISHQWRQPLGSIASATIALKSKISLEKYDLSKPAERDAFLEYLMQRLDNIESYTASLSTTIDDFKNFYNPNKELIKADVTQAVEKALFIMKSSFNHHHVTLEKVYHDSVKIDHYPSELMQVILNILNNAVGNFKEKQIQNSHISLSLQAQKSSIMIEICDNGGGIPSDIIDKIFDPYFSTKDEKNGTGLGLYMSKTIIENHHHGALQVANKNGGACFTITLPKSQNTAPVGDALPKQM